MRLTLGVFVLLFAVCGCRKTSSPADLGAKMAKPAARPAGPTVQQPGFDVAVRLSAKARALLIAKSETIVVSVSFEGGPKPGTPRQYVGDDGQVVDLGGREVEVAPGATARFGNLEANKAALARVQGAPAVLINVFSGRKSSKDNLLDCGIYEGPLSTVADSVVPIDCKLIAE